MSTLDAANIVRATEVVRGELGRRVARASTGRPGQPLANEMFELIVSQSLIPILVAVTSTRLNDVLKDRRLRRLKRTDAERAASELAGAEIRRSDEIDAEAVSELQKILAPMGMSDGDIDALVDLVRQEVTR